MERCIKPIGGEFCFDLKLFNNNNNNLNNKKYMFLSGGQSCIQYIIKDINFKSDEYILMPSYLCPSILYSFYKNNVNLMFYKIDANLNVNIMDIEEKLHIYKIKAIYVIDYFGFCHKKETIEYFEVLKNKNIVLIEDAVQMLWFKKNKEFVGDYVFNSFRKFLPIDGSILLNKNHVHFDFYNYDYYELIKKARISKTKFLKFKIGTEKNFLNLFDEADKAYYEINQINGIELKSLKMLDKIDFDFISRKRIENYRYLYEKVKQNYNIQCLFDFKNLKGNAPIGFPVLVKNRDFIRMNLRKYKIYCPVHWNILSEEWSTNFIESRKISEKILTIPIDWTYTFEDLDIVLKKLNKLLLIKKGE